MEILGGGVIETVVVEMVFLPIGETPRDAGSPYDEKLLFLIVVEKFWCPDIDSGGVVHHLDKTLFTPMNQVAGGRVTEAPVATP